MRQWLVRSRLGWRCPGTENPRPGRRGFHIHTRELVSATAVGVLAGGNGGESGSAPRLPTRWAWRTLEAVMRDRRAASARQPLGSSIDAWFGFRMGERGGGDLSEGPGREIEARRCGLLLATAVSWASPTALWPACRKSRQRRRLLESYRGFLESAAASAWMSHGTTGTMEVL